eukprot:4569536-Ditylum_brightwellii.AAC.1
MMTPEQQIPMTETPWQSEELHTAHKLVKYWKQRFYYQRKGLNKEEELRQLEQQCNVDVDVFQGNIN